MIGVEELCGDLVGQGVIYTAGQPAGEGQLWVGLGEEREQCHGKQRGQVY